MAYRRWPNDYRGGGGWDASEWAFHSALEALSEQRRRASEINRQASRRVIWPSLLVAAALIATRLSGIDISETDVKFLLVVVLVAILSATCILPGLLLEGRLKDIDLTDLLHPDPAIGLSAVIRRLTEEAEALREPNERTIKQIRILAATAVAGIAFSVALLLGGLLLIALW